MPVNRRHILDEGSNSSSRSASRARTPRPDGEENGQLDFTFNNLEELLAKKLESLENYQDGSDLRQSQAAEMGRSRITSSNTSINDIIHSLQQSRTDVSSESRELLLAQLYKLIVIKSLLVSNEENLGSKNYVDDNKVQDLVYILMKNDSRSSHEFLLLFRSVIALIASDIDEFSSIVDGEFTNFIKNIIAGPSTSIITNENKSHVISGYVGLLLVLNNGSSGYGMDDTINWLFEITDGVCISAINAMRDFKQGNREHSTYFDDLSHQRIIDEIMYKQNSESLIAVAGLHGVGCLLTLLQRNDFLNGVIEELMPKLVELLDNEENIEISKASGRVIGLCYEIFSYNNEEEEDDEEEFNFNSPYYEQEQLVSILTRLTNLSSKKISKKDKKEVHSIFRDILNTIKNYSKKETRVEIYKKSEEGMEILNSSMDSNYIKLSRTRSIQINSWFLYLRLVHLKWCFGFGVHNQLVSNGSIRDILKEPPTDYEMKYGVVDQDDEDFRSFKNINEKYDVNDKKRSNMLKKARENKLTEEMDDLGIED